MTWELLTPLKEETAKEELPHLSALYWSEKIMKI